VIKVVDTRYWRAAFDVKTNDKDPVDLRCFLRLGDKTLSETWLYQFFPPA
jgi:glucans biosynthesis protein